MIFEFEVVMFLSEKGSRAFGRTDVLLVFNSALAFETVWFGARTHTHHHILRKLITDTAFEFV